MQKKLDEVCGILKTLEENFGLELDEISKLMRMRLRAELGNCAVSHEADQLFKGVRELNSKQLELSKNIFESFQSQLGILQEVSEDGFREGFHQAS